MPVRRIACAIVLTIAYLGAIQSKSIRGAIIQAFLASKSRSAFTHARYVVTIRPIMAVTRLQTVHSKLPRRATIGAHVADPTPWTRTLATGHITNPLILAPTIVVATRPNSSRRTLATER